ncbi:hypothetical protein F993_01953 [Acinetobacter proteolyticus]|uniref:DUF2004 domain-containing protein n=1 Tax=Acinetobacter proteolyticus TaxID=1776741 RepID=A0ABP2TN73_9GAMM|nr:DUF2004 domain-containing protein [Acinetobacter proteolyticus]ENU23799.1 hypothetical protein F993_01953 [Acinetobacter proteolyticus]
MNKIDHSYFGALNTDAVDPGRVDVIWEQKFSLAGETVDVPLWVVSGEKMDIHRLDAFSNHLNNLPALDIAARKQIGLYLEEDRGFIKFHIEEVPRNSLDQDWSIIEALAPNGTAVEVDVHDFVKAMRLTTVSLFYFEKGEPIIMDYVIGEGVQGLAEQILAVKFTENSEFVDVSWESG